MPYRKVPLVEGEIYHIYNRSIAEYKIFNSNNNYERMLKTITFYTIENLPCKLSLLLRDRKNPPLIDIIKFAKSQTRKIVKLIAYCLMPTHYHFIIQQLKNEGISKYINFVQKSYSKFFNTKYKRKGPLWERRFENVLVETDEQFLHLTRYIHLNPVTAGLVDRPEDWKYSSYKEYIVLTPEKEGICDFREYLNMDPGSYKEFVNQRIDYQRELAKIKHLIVE